MTEFHNPPKNIKNEPRVAFLPDGSCGCLVALTGTAIGRLYKLTQPHHVIGHAANATIHLDDPGIVARHAELRQENGHVVLVVLDQDAETYVNGVSVRERVLTDGDRIKLGTIATLKYSTLANNSFYPDRIT